jgi:glycosyltransferase involved in cell wall biosynthesis
VQRIAIVQHGDYAQACRLAAEGKPETYAGQRDTIETYDGLFGAVPHLIVSLDGDSSAEQRGLGEIACVRPRKVAGVPARVGLHIAAWRIRRRIERFEATQLLLRCSNLIGCDLLAWANRRRIPAAVITAMRFDPDSSACVRFCQLANDQNVGLVANHHRIATQTMVACGLRPDKPIVYDFTRHEDPDQIEPKRAPAGREPTILFAGVVSESKGALDLLRAAERLRRAGRKFRMAFLGDGPVHAAILNHPGTKEGWIESPGRVGNEQVVRRMRESDIIVVPSRHEFPEGMPQVLSEGLAARTPMVISDHPVFLGYFREGQGVRYYPAGNDAALADTIAKVLDDPSEYERLSRASADAWRSFQVETKLRDVLHQVGRMWGLETAVPVTAGR